MEIKVLQQTKDRLEFEIKGEDHTLCNALKEQLLSDRSVKIATYAVSHPLTAIPKFLIEGTNPKRSLEKAINNLDKIFSELKKSFKSIRK